MFEYFKKTMTKEFEMTDIGTYGLLSGHWSEAGGEWDFYFLKRLCEGYRREVWDVNSNSVSTPIKYGVI